MLNKLTLNNFKCWQELKEMRCARVTGLFGTNSSGKSSVLQSLLLLKQTLESSDRSLPLLLGDESDYVELGSYREVVNQHDTKRSLGFSFEWALKKPLALKDSTTHSTASPLFSGNKADFTCEIELADKKKMRVKEMLYGFDNQRFGLTHKEGNTYQLDSTNIEGPPFRFKRKLGRKWDIPQPIKFHGFPDQVTTYYQNTGFLAELQGELETLFNNIYYLGPLREFPKRRYVWSGGVPDDVGQRGERVFDAILAAKDRKEYIRRGGRKHLWSLDRMLAYQLQKLGLIHSFSVAKIADGSGIYQVKVKKTKDSAGVLLPDVGFGVSQVLPVIALCYYVPEGSTILLEQPEIHLHPSVQSGLADIFIDVAKHRNVQIIVESHSEHLLTRLQRRIAEEEITRNDIALYFCNTDKQQSVMQELQLDLFGNIKNWPEGFFGDRFGEIVATQEARLKREIKAEKGQ
jgi:predicted ATPase